MVQSTNRTPGTPSARKRSERLEARITSDQKVLIERAAAIQGRSVTDFLIASVQEAARKAIEDYEVLHLSARDSKLFVAAMLNPRAPDRTMLDAVTRYKARMGDA